MQLSLLQWGTQLWVTSWVLQHLNCSRKIKHSQQKSHRFWSCSLPGLNNFFCVSKENKISLPLLPSNTLHIPMLSHETYLYYLFHTTSGGSSIPSLQMSLRTRFEGLQETTCIKRTLKVQFCLTQSSQQVPSRMTGPPVFLQGVTHPEAEEQTLPQSLPHPSMAKTTKVHLRLEIPPS